MKLTDAEIAAMPAKSLRDPEVTDLYRARDFLDAYAEHTKHRIERDGYKAAIGDGAHWDAHGRLQRDFLIAWGLTPEHSLLDFGCGTGRLARQVVPYLHTSNYFGVDIAPAAIDAAKELARTEGWATAWPTFSVAVPTWRTFDFIWSFSVFIHLPLEIMCDVMLHIAGAMHEHSRFFWAYVPEVRAYRSGLKQFRHTLDDYKSAAAHAGLTFDDVPDWIERAGHTPGRWSGSQRIALSVIA